MIVRVMKLQKVYKDIRGEPDGKARNNSHNTRLHQNNTVDCT